MGKPWKRFWSLPWTSEKILNWGARKWRKLRYDEHGLTKRSPFTGFMGNKCKGGSTMKKDGKQLYKAALYLRLSVQNANEATGESDSIANQEALLRTYLKSHSEIEVKYVFKDDGWSGVNFNRPGFQKMMQKIYDSEVDCVVVKDLSRLGRNHTETGKYITRVFPAFGVRFIAVNDNVDTAGSDAETNSIIIPFKDLLNDSYSRDISMKVRSAIAVKKEAGEILGGKAPYGYSFSADAAKKQYVVDQEAADIIRRIYSWTFDGLGSTEIVRRLNYLHILPPSEYKKSKEQGSGYVPKDTKWNIYQVYRILHNDVYTGILRLGKSTTPNYKVKKIIQVPDEDQYVFENAHEAIISPAEYELMQDLLSRDSRVSMKQGSGSVAYPLTGYVYCADCGASMVVKSTHKGEKQYRYYVCGENKKNKSVCHTHSVSYEKINEVVLKALNTHLKVLLEAEKIFEKRDVEILAQPAIEKIQIRIGKILEEKYRLTEFVKGIYHDYREGLLTEKEYLDLKSDYQEQIEELTKNAAKLEQEKQSQAKSEMSNYYWIQKYKNSGKLKELSRRDVITFIDRVDIKDADHIKIRFRFGDEYAGALKRLKKAKDGEGAVANG